MDRIAVGSIRVRAGGRIDHLIDKCVKVEFGIIDPTCGTPATLDEIDDRRVEILVDIAETNRGSAKDPDWFRCSPWLGREGDKISTTHPVISAVLTSGWLTQDQLDGAQPIKLWLNTSNNYNSFGDDTEEEYIIVIKDD